MLRGEMAGLRARHDSDIAVLEEELYNDIETRSRADTRPWRPVPPGSASSPFRVADPQNDPAVFSVVELASGELAGGAVLWGVDTHNRVGHIGISLRRAFRGKGLGTDTVRLLCRYGFLIRGLHRLQAETLADNTAMIRAATQAGFTQEGVLRRAAWVNGEFLDEVIFGQLDSEWNCG
jgi:RimJ/RimL family protein N-acetyltransferase